MLNFNKVNEIINYLNQNNKKYANDLNEFVKEAKSMVEIHHETIQIKNKQDREIEFLNNEITNKDEEICILSSEINELQEELKNKENGDV